MDVSLGLEAPLSVVRLAGMLKQAGPPRRQGDPLPPVPPAWPSRRTA
jgi:hypothetical protein